MSIGNFVKIKYNTIILPCTALLSADSRKIITDIIKIEYVTLLYLIKLKIKYETKGNSRESI